MNLFLKALIFALIAAVGNALFVFGQKKSSVAGNPFLFLMLSLCVGILLLAIASLFFPKPNYSEYFRDNYNYILITGTGIFITYVGFYYLYAKFGASYYILYAILSIVTTSIIVGVLIFKETFNIFYLLSILSAVLTIVLFFFGKKA